MRNMIKYKSLLTISLLILFLACQDSVMNSAETLNNRQIKSQDEKSFPVAIEKDELWIPTAIEECIAKIDVGEPFEFEADFNPFYLRADLDGNNFTDYAVLIKGQTTQKRGVVMCKDSKQPFVLGALSKPKVPLSSFDDDNFVTNQWEISTKEETKNWIIRYSGGRKIAPDAKGESIVFIFEGGDGIVIYWDGRTFKIGE